MRPIRFNDKNNSQIKGDIMEKQNFKKIELKDSEWPDIQILYMNYDTQYLDDGKVIPPPFEKEARELFKKGYQLTDNIMMGLPEGYIFAAFIKKDKEKGE